MMMMMMMLIGCSSASVHHVSEGEVLPPGPRRPEGGDHTVSPSPIGSVLSEIPSARLRFPSETRLHSLRLQALIKSLQVAGGLAELGPLRSESRPSAGYLY